MWCLESAARIFWRARICNRESCDCGSLGLGIELGSGVCGAAEILRASLSDALRVTAVGRADALAVTVGIGRARAHSAGSGAARDHGLERSLEHNGEAVEARGL
jgi:hypothetical protein